MKTTITIQGMHCASCEALLTDVLSETEGVVDAHVSLKNGNATVEFDDKTVSEARLRRLIEAEGYKTA
ncbi:TPA: heavy-metal-associated domain-containing protein [Candidatus Woesearchaeota archaeon]|nr:heavy-metal-associated domain-containing protein [Candidatus Woesearchaeota archaeon]